MEGGAYGTPFRVDVHQLQNHFFEGNFVSEWVKVGPKCVSQNPLSLAILISRLRLSPPLGRSLFCGRDRSGQAVANTCRMEQTIQICLRFI